MTENEKKELMTKINETLKKNSLIYPIYENNNAHNICVVKPHCCDIVFYMSFKNKVQFYPTKVNNLEETIKTCFYLCQDGFKFKKQPFYNGYDHFKQMFNIRYNFKKNDEIIIPYQHEMIDYQDSNQRNLLF